MKQITCRQAVDFIPKKEEGKLSAWQQIQLWRHLAYWNLCRYSAKQSKVITEAFAGLNQEDKRHIIEVITHDAGSEL